MLNYLTLTENKTPYGKYRELFDLDSDNWVKKLKCVTGTQPTWRGRLYCPHFYVDQFIQVARTTKSGQT